jgi:hypothetical protein
MAVLIRVNGDDTKEAAQNSAATAKIKWRSFRNGGPDGPISGGNRDRSDCGKFELNGDGTFEFTQCKSLSHEKRIEGKYVIATAEKSLSVLEAMAIYKDLADVERGFRQLKDVLALRPIFHQVGPW